MLTNLTNKVKETRTLIRKQLLETVLTQFDQELMGLSKEMQMEKYEKMAESPFRFYRGSAYLFYFDIVKIPFSFHTPEQKPTWIQGDLHFENFGAFQNEKGELVYDINDFDEGYLGSYLYDLLRMCVSIALYGEALGLTKEEQEERIGVYLTSYYKQLNRFEKGKEHPYSAVFTKENTKGPIKKVLKKLEKRKADHLLEDITHIKEDGERGFLWSEEIQPADKGTIELIVKAWPEYIHSVDAAVKKPDPFYKIKDLAIKRGSGTASIGLDRFYAIIEGEKGDNNDLILEIKEVRPPVPGYFLPFYDSFWDEFLHQGQRVVATQKAMHHSKDPYLGYLTIDGRDFYVRERSPYKKRIKAKHLSDLNAWDAALTGMGQITAKIHARADKDLEDGLLDYHSEKEILKAIGNQFDIFKSELIFSSISYKHQVNQDYHLFCNWFNQA